MSTEPAAKRQKTEEKPKEAKSDEAKILLGTVAHFQKRRYGFITPDAGGEDIFVHESVIVSEDEQPSLHKGQRVGYIAVSDEKSGKMRAAKVMSPDGTPLGGKRKKAGKPKPVALPAAELNAKVKKQVEYYLSDLNLRRDGWMREQLTAPPTGAIPTTQLFKCKKLAALTTDVTVLTKALEGSELKLVKDAKAGDCVSRADKPMPAFLEPTVIGMAQLKEGATWKDVRAAFSHLCQLPVAAYVNKEAKEGFVVVTVDETEQPAQHKMLTKLIAGGKLTSPDDATITIATIKKLEGDERTARLDQQKAMSAKKGLKRRRGQQEAKSGRWQDAVGPIELDGKTYPGGRQEIWEKVQAIMGQYKDEEPLLGEDKEMMHALFRLHPHGSDKLKNMKTLMIKVNPKFEVPSRCFYVVKKDGAQDDISFVKCLRELPLASSQPSAKKAKTA